MLRQSSRLVDANESPADHGGGAENTDFEEIVGIATTPLVTLAVAMETLRGVLGDVIDDAVAGALVWAESYFEEDGWNPLGLSRDQIGAIYLYTSEWPLNIYAPLNRALRSALRALQLQPYFPYLRLLLGALYSLPTRTMTLWRGMRRTVGELGYQSGSRTMWWGFSSATPSARVLSNPMFLGTSGERIIFHIVCRCVDISPYSEFGDQENERLIEPGTTFAIGDILYLGNDLSQVVLEQDLDARSPFDFRPPDDRANLDEVEEVRREADRREEAIRKEVTRKRIMLGVAVFFEHLLVVGLGLWLGYRYFAPGDSQWTEGPATVKPFRFGSAVVLEEQMYLLRGGGGIDIWDGDAWKEKGATVPPTMPGKSQSWYKAVAWNGKIYATNDNNMLDNDVYQLEKNAAQCATIESDSSASYFWQTIPASMRTDRWRYELVVFQEKVYAIGGTDADNNHPIASVEVFEGQAWTPAPSLTWARLSFTAVEVGRFLYVIGGFASPDFASNAGVTSSVERFDGTQWVVLGYSGGGKWDDASSRMTYPRKGHRAAALDSRIYVFGGTSESAGRALPAIEVATVDTETGDLAWTTCTAATSTYAQPRAFGMALVLFKEKFWAIGGVEQTSDFEETSNVSKFEPRGEC